MLRSIAPHILRPVGRHGTPPQAPPRAPPGPHPGPPPGPVPARSSRRGENSIALRQAGHAVLCATVPVEARHLSPRVFWGRGRERGAPGGRRPIPLEASRSIGHFAPPPPPPRSFLAERGESDRAPAGWTRSSLRDGASRSASPLPQGFLGERPGEGAPCGRRPIPLEASRSIGHFSPPPPRPRSFLAERGESDRAPAGWTRSSLRDGASRSAHLSPRVFWGRGRERGRLADADRSRSKRLDPSATSPSPEVGP